MTAVTDYMRIMAGKEHQVPCLQRELPIFEGASTRRAPQAVKEHVLEVERSKGAPLPFSFYQRLYILNGNTILCPYLEGTSTEKHHPHNKTVVAEWT